jgi:hypothetical protein
MSSAKNFNVGDRFEVTSNLGMDSGYVGNKGTVVSKYDDGYGVVMDGDEWNKWVSDDSYMTHLLVTKATPKKNKKEEKPKNEVFYMTIDEYIEKTTIVDSKGNILQDRHEALYPEENFTIIRNGTTTVVITDEGCKGVSKLHPEDEYDDQLGFEIAYCKAMIKRWEKMLKSRTR